MSGKIKIIIIILILIVAITIVFFIVDKIDKNKQTQPEKLEPEKPEVLINQEIEKIKLKHGPIENQRTKEININNKIYELALVRQDKEICLFIENFKSRDLCLKQVAIKTFNINLCQEISDAEDMNNCLNQVALAQAENNKNLSLCAKIEDEMLRLTCLDRVIDQGASVEDCEQIPLRYWPRTPENDEEVELRDECTSKVIYKQAISENNEALCEQIHMRYIKAKCLGKLKSIPLNSDYDNDGLNYYQEIIHQTNPNDPDTDQDGFSDGEEVEYFYNPRE